MLNSNISDVYFSMDILFDYFFLLSGLALGTMSVYLFCSVMFVKTNEVDSLAWAEESKPESSNIPLIKISRPLVHNLSLKYVKYIKFKNYRNSIEHKLLTSGLNKELNTEEFIGMQILWGVMFPVFFAIVNFTFQLNYSHLIEVLLVLIGLYFPHLFCNSNKQKRNSSINMELPFFVDLLSLSTEAGLDFFGAIQKITEKAKKSVLATEFLIMQKDIKLGSSRKDALNSMAKRLDIDEITSVCSMIVDADETGASIAKALKIKSVQMRETRFMNAEKEGAKASQKMLLPMIFLILPAVGLTIFAPIGLKFFYGGGV